MASSTLTYESPVATIMNPESILIAGKALIWFAIPLGLAVWELWRLRDKDGE